MFIDEYEKTKLNMNPFLWSIYHDCYIFVRYFFNRVALFYHVLMIDISWVWWTVRIRKYMQRIICDIIWFTLVHKAVIRWCFCRAHLKILRLFYLSMIHYNCNIFKLWYQTIHLDNFHLLLPSVPNSRDQWVLLRNPTEWNLQCF